MNSRNSLQTVWIVRHGNRQDFVDPGRDWNHEPPLSADGIVQAKETGERLKSEGIRHIFASPFYRTVQTAHAIADVLDLPVKIEKGACEWLNPEWFDRMHVFIPPEKLKEIFPRIDASYTPLVEPIFPETREQAFKRCSRTINLLTEICPDDFLVVGHGASVVEMTRGLLGNREQAVHCGLCALVKVRVSVGERVLQLNGDTSHLFEGEKHRDRLV